MTQKVIQEKVFPVLATISTFSLLLISISLLPLAKWSRTQNECIEKTTNDLGLKQTELATKVMRCNGGHE